MRAPVSEVSTPAAEIAAVPTPWVTPALRLLGTFADLTRGPKTFGTSDSVFYDDIGLVPGDPLS
jgi:hypothetical protein